MFGRVKYQITQSVKNVPNPAWIKAIELWATATAYGARSSRVTLKMMANQRDQLFILSSATPRVIPMMRYTTDCASNLSGKGGPKLGIKLTSTENAIKK